MSVQPTTKSPEEITYPSVDLAYPIAIETYQWAQKKKEAVNDRILKLLAFSVSLVLVAPPLIRSNVPQATFRSAWFILAIVAFLVAVILGIIASFKGKLRFIDPRHLYKEWLHLSEQDFKAAIIYGAGQDLEFNYSSMLVKRRLAIAMLLFFSLGAVLLYVWLITSLP